MLGKHLLGIYEKALNPADDWSLRLKKAGSLGFDYLEISIDEQDERLARLKWTRQARQTLYNECMDAQVPLRSMCLSAHRRFPFGSADAKTRQTAHDIMERALEFACDLGIRVIQLAGYDVYYEESTPESRALFAEGMHWAAEQAEKYQIMLGMEIMDTPFMNSISKHMRYEREISSPWYKVYPDLGNLTAWPENNAAEELDVGIDSIVAVHLKDTLAVTKSFPGKFKCVDFGAGCVDFVARFAQLEMLGYSGPYMIEMWHEQGQDDVESVRQSKAYLESQFALAMEKMQ